MKGPKWVEEKAEADELGVLKKVDVRVMSEYEVPGLDWKSYIIQMKAST